MQAYCDILANHHVKCTAEHFSKLADTQFEKLMLASVT